MELLRIDKSVKVFHTNASTSVAVTNGTSFSFLTLWCPAAFGDFREKNA